MSRSDDDLTQSYSNFVSKFECAANRIKSMGLAVSCNMQHGILQQSRRYPHKGMIRVYAPQYKTGHWYICKNHEITELHPFILILDGMYTRTQNVDSDIEELFRFNPNTIGCAFLDGYYNDSQYKDVWTHKDWSVGAAFHVGRYFLEKYCGHKLKYKIPTILKARGIIK